MWRRLALTGWTAVRGRRCRLTVLSYILRYGFDFAHDFAHDLALLHLSEPADAELVTLLGADSLALAGPGTLGTVIGWGALSEDGSAGLLSYDLQQVELPIVSEEECASSMGRMITEKHAVRRIQAGGQGRLPRRQRRPPWWCRTAKAAGSWPGW